MDRSFFRGPLAAEIHRSQTFQPPVNADRGHETLQDQTGRNDDERPLDDASNGGAGRFFGDGVHDGPAPNGAGDAGAEQAPSDAELELGEGLDALLDRPVEPAREAFRASLKDAFVGGEIRLAEPDPADETELPAEIRAALDAWSPVAGATSRRDQLKEAFVGGEIRLTAPDPVDESELPGEIRAALDEWNPVTPSQALRSNVQAAFLGADGAARRPAATSTPGSRVQRASHGRAERRRSSAPAPARRLSTQLRLVVGGTLLAAAAAVVLLLKGGLGSSQPTWSIDPTQVAQLGAAEVLASLRVDGQRIDSLDELDAALSGARRIETDMTLRLRQGEEYVMELAEGTALDMAFADPTAPEGADVYFAESGSIRVATGPNYDPVEPLILHTAHVRTQVVGTIYGIDVYPGSSCVCCFEGVVATQMKNEDGVDFNVEAQQTRVVKEDLNRALGYPLVVNHRAPLEALDGYWREG